MIVSEEQREEIGALSSDAHAIVEYADALIRTKNKAAITAAREIIGRARRLHTTLDGYYKKASVQTALDL
jgi:DNA-binding phage protein